MGDVVVDVEPLEVCSVTFSDLIFVNKLVAEGASLVEGLLILRKANYGVPGIQPVARLDDLVLPVRRIRLLVFIGWHLWSFLSF